VPRRRRSALLRRYALGFGQLGKGGDALGEHREGRSRSDHEAIDRVLASRVAAEDGELAAVSGPGTLLDRLLQPLNG
jgi:hypothetical protein